MNTRSVSKPPTRHKIEMRPVISEAIKSIGHHPGSETLRVEFHSGHVYEYPGVSAADHQAFEGAESIGRHFQAHIRGRIYRRLEKAA